MTGIEPSGLAGSAFVAIWHDIAPEGLETFYAWHDREHMPERLAIPGFRRGRRYIRVAGDGQSFFNLYEVDAFDVLVGKDYLARLNAPTPWTRQAVVHFRNVTRGLCRVAASGGPGQGEVISTLRIVAAEGGDGTLQGYLAREVIPALLGHAGITGAHLGLTDPGASTVETAEKQARNKPTDIPTWVLLVEGVSAERVRSARDGPLAGSCLAAHGVARNPVTGIYQLEATRTNLGL